MPVPCEVVVQSVLPVVRANIARVLVEVHGFSQKKAALLLGLTQPAVSFYLSESRGKSSVFEKDLALKKFVDDFALKLSKNCLDEKEKLDSFCNICRYVRSTKLICSFHGVDKNSDCSVCLESLPGD